VSVLASARGRSRLAGALAVVVVILLDQAAKAVVERRLRLGEVLGVIDGFFDLTHARNLGGVWGLGGDLSPVVRTVVFLALPVVITGFAAWYSWSLPPGAAWRQLALALVVGGAVGNLVDRLTHHPPAVVDFILVHWHGHYWPAFNIADSAICTGVAILLVGTFVDDEEAEVPPPTPPAGRE
jgi:signal peptidase II